MTLENILADFEFLDDWEDHYRYVIEPGRSLPPLPEEARTEANKVRGCSSQVWLATDVDGAAAGIAPRLRFKGDSDAHIRARVYCHLLRDLLRLVRGRDSTDRCAGRVPAFRVGRGSDAAALERIRGDACRALSGEIKGGGGAGHRTNKQRSIDSVQSCEEGAMTFMAKDLAVTTSSDGIRHQTIASRLRERLQMIAKRRVPTTYQELTKVLGLTPPHTIHQLAEALEHLMAEDAANNCPFIAAIAISKARGGLPAPGFFDCARRLGRFAGDETGPEAWAFHAQEFNAALAFWTATATTDKSG